MNVSFADSHIHVTSHEANTWVCPIILKEDCGVRRVCEPVTLGIPLPRGMVMDPLQLGLMDERGKRIPLQKEILARWVDGSIQWVLVDFFANVDPHTRVVYQLIPVDVSEQQNSRTSLFVTRTEHQLVVDTGVVQFDLGLHVLKPFDAIVIGGCSVIQPEGTSLVLVDQQGETYQPVIEHLTVETEGPIRATVRIDGSFSNHMTCLGKFIARLSFFRNTA